MFCFVECDSKRFIDFKTKYLLLLPYHLRHFCISQQQAYNVRTTTESLNPCIQLFIPIKRIFFGSILFQKKSQRRGIPQRLLDTYSDMLICISFKLTLSSGRCQHPVVYFGQVFGFCRLINKSVLEWFLLMCK